MDVGQQDITTLLAAIRAGQPHAKEQLVTHIYSELRSLAGDLMRGERPDHTLQPTALV
ncbi:MAG: RNA polymerase subunit sigma, partial [Phycisphaerae bacterium]|nr:RNA polymerase subunit sigma [Phycisphaerae bacterium]